MAEFLIRRAFPWMQEALDPVSPGSSPAGVSNLLSPIVGIFGTQRLAELRHEDVPGALGAIEVAHTEVPQGTVRRYNNIQYFHDDAVARVMVPGIIYQTGAAFPFVALRDALSRGATDANNVANVLVLRQFWIGPRQRLAVRADAMGAGARLSIRLAFVDMPIGETVNF